MILKKFKIVLGLCTECSDKLNYKHKKKEIKRKKPKLKKSKCRHSKDEETLNLQITAGAQDDPQLTSKLTVEDNVWSEQLQIEDDKPREDDFENYLEQLLF